MNPHKNGWVGSISKQQSVITKNMLDVSRGQFINGIYEEENMQEFIKEPMAQRTISEIDSE